MRLIKFAFIGLLFFVGILTAFSLFIPSHIRISKAVAISRSADSVLYFISHVDQWPRWHPAFKGKAMPAWLQKNKLRLTPVQKSDSLIVINWQQQGKTPVVNGWQLYRFGPSDSVALQWYMDFHLQWYPWQKFGSLLYESTYGRMMEEGLQNIKALAMKTPGSVQ